LKHYADAFESSQSNEKSIESRLIEITVKALNIDSIGLDDNFYDFGADSLLMAQMATTIRNELASDKTFDAILKQLLDFPTITEVAQFLKNEVTEESGDSGELIQLQRIGKSKNNCARILLPTVLWNNEMYHEIIPLMEKQDEGEIFTFKLSNPQQFFDINPDEVASVLAKTFAEKIIEAQIEKVQIIGYSFSGKMSLELAERLENAGIEIADFVIVEGARLPFEIKQTNMKDFFFATLIGVDPQKVGFKFEDITFLMNRYIEETKKKIIDESDFEKIISQSPDAAAIRNFNALSASERFQKIKEYSGDFGNSMTDEAFARIKNTFDQNFNVMVNYNPTPYFGDLRYLKADNSNSIFKNADKFLFQKWDDLCIGEINYEQLKGDHFTAFTSKEYAIDLAEKLSISNIQENA
jgi:pyochelin synthetase